LLPAAALFLQEIYRHRFPEKSGLDSEPARVSIK
jgi:hypothetical protein